MLINQQAPGMVEEVAAAHQDIESGSGRIVVGMDGSAQSMAALDWAIREARMRGSSVKVVMAWQHPQAYGAANVWGLGMDPAFDTEGVLSSAAEAETVRLAQQAGSSQGVPTTWEAVEGHPAGALVDCSETAELLVVGSRGHGGFVGMLLGSVSQHVIAHAKCPVVVVRDTEGHNSDAA